MNPIIVRNMTKLLTKESYMYSLGGLSFTYPIKMSKILYFIIVWLIVFLPMLFLMGFNWVTLAIPVGAGLGLGQLFSSPIWDGKTFPKFIAAKIYFYKMPKEYFDNRAIDPYTNHKIDYTIQVSRRKDYQKLYNHIKERKKKGLVKNNGK